MSQNFRRAVTVENFFVATQGFFSPCSEPVRKPDFVSNGAGTSVYWYEDDMVIRKSNHWGFGIRKCDWFLAGENANNVNDLKTDDITVAKCSFDDFYHKSKRNKRPLVSPISH